MNRRIRATRHGMLRHGGSPGPCRGGVRTGRSAAHPPPASQWIDAQQPKPAPAMTLRIHKCRITASARRTIGAVMADRLNVCSPASVKFDGANHA